MVKKVVKKASHKRKRTRENKAKEHHKSETPKSGMSESKREDILIENFVGLQKAMTNLSIKFGALSDNILKLLQVFEEAAKNYAQTGSTNNDDMLNKINSLLDQNKTIARGLVLMEGKLRGRAEPPTQRAEPLTQFSREFSRSGPRPLPSI